MRCALLALLLTGCYAAHERPPMCTDDAAPADLPHYGVVSIFSQTAGAHEGWALTGFFGEESLAAHDANEIAGATVVARIGDCVALTAAAVVAQGEDAGDLTASDGDVVAVAHALSAYHDAETASPIPVRAGDVVQLTGSGGAVPPFAACVTMPGAIGSPILPLRWTVGTALTARWDRPTDFDTAELDIGAVVGTRIQVVHCRVDADAGGLQVPAPLWELVAEGSQITLTLSRTRVVAAGEYAIRASAARSLTGTLTLE